MQGYGLKLSVKWNLASKPDQIKTGVNWQSDQVVGLTVSCDEVEILFSGGSS